MILMKWAIAAVLTLLLWGVWGVLLKKISVKAEWYTVYLVTNTAIVLVMLTIVFTKGFSHISVLDTKSIIIGLAAGLAGTLGYIFLIWSLQWGGKASVVIPLTSLYPAITVVLSYIVLGENLSYKQIAGIIFAMIAIVLLSSQD